MPTLPSGPHHNKEEEDDEEGQEGEEDEKDDDEDEAMNRLSYPTYVGIQYWQKSYSFGISIF